MRPQETTAGLAELRQARSRDGCGTASRSVAGGRARRQPTTGPDRDVLVPAELGARARLARRTGARGQPAVGQPPDDRRRAARDRADLDARGRHRRDLARATADARAREPERPRLTPSDPQDPQGPQDPQDPHHPERHPATRLIVTANYDAGRTALIYRDPLRGTAASLRRLTGGAGPGWQAWLSIAIAWPLAIAIVRTTQTHASSLLGALQLPPTVALVARAGASARGRRRRLRARCGRQRNRRRDRDRADPRAGRRPSPQPDGRTDPSRRRRQRAVWPAQVPPGPQARARAPERGRPRHRGLRRRTAKLVAERRPARAPRATRAACERWQRETGASPAPRPGRDAGAARRAPPASRRSRSAASTIAASRPGHTNEKTPRSNSTTRRSTARSSSGCT